MNSDHAQSGGLMDILTDVALFSAAGSGIRLRRYQRAAAEAIVQSVIRQQGRSFVVMFPRQSGKNELQAQIETYLLTVFSQEGGEIIKVSPTWKPQSINAMRRLERTLRRNIITKDLWKKEAGYIYRIGNASIAFLSGAPESNIVGATASLLLELDEAQDIQPAKYEHEIAPMAASLNATRVFWGTAWTEDSLLSPEMQAALLSEKRSPSQRRVFRIDAETVSQEVPAYGRFVAEQIQRLGRDHPLIRTQYFSEELNGQTSLFGPERIRKMQGSHSFLPEPEAGMRLIILIDIAGADETSQSPDSETGSKRDATAITLCRIVDPQDGATFGVIWQPVQRLHWLNIPLTEQSERLLKLIAFWAPEQTVIDASGVGAGIASFLIKKVGDGRIHPFVFSAASKSKLGWDFLSIIDTGRWQEAAADPVQYPEQSALQQQFFQELKFCQSAIQPGVEKRLKWGVADGTRDPLTGKPVHDDLVMSAALAAVLDAKLWQADGETFIIPGKDPLQDLDRGY